MTQNLYYGQQQPVGPPPDNNLVWAILVTVFCCLPLGIVSIVKSSQVNTLWAQGQFDAARKSADDAKKFALWSVGAGVAVAVLYFLFVVVLAGSSSL
ncbi:MAG: CD225/dispanin family protein [Rhodococcus qingshengii]